jgi:hypothetical protein
MLVRARLVLTGPLVLYLFGPCRGAHSASPPLTGIALSITVVVPNRETGMEPVVLKKLVLATGRRSVFGALFDKSNLKEEKRRRRSPSVVSKSSSELERPTILWRILRFLSHHRCFRHEGNLVVVSVSVKVPVTQYPWRFPPSRPESNFSI